MLADHPTGRLRDSRPLVLLIEGNIAQRDVHALTLELVKNVAVSTATSGERGYALACSEYPDAIVVDALLPDVDGLQVCERLLANPETASTPLIVLTGDDAAYARAKIMWPLDAVLKNPCRADQLSQVLAHALAARRLH